MAPWRRTSKELLLALSLAARGTGAGPAASLVATCFSILSRAFGRVANVLPRPALRNSLAHSPQITGASFPTKAKNPKRAMKTCAQRLPFTPAQCNTVVLRLNVPVNFFTEILLFGPKGHFDLLVTILLLFIYLSIFRKSC